MNMRTQYKRCTWILVDRQCTKKSTPCERVNEGVGLSRSINACEMYADQIHTYLGFPEKCFGITIEKAFSRYAWCNALGPRIFPLLSPGCANLPAINVSIKWCSSVFRCKREWSKEKWQAPQACAILCLTNVQQCDIARLVIWCKYNIFTGKRCRRDIDSAATLLCATFPTGQQILAKTNRLGTKNHVSCYRRAKRKQFPTRIDAEFQKKKNSAPCDFSLIYGTKPY